MMRHSLSSMGCAACACLLVLVGFYETADACSFLAPPDEEASICRSWRSPAIFTGRVTGIASGGGVTVTTFVVFASFRGVTTKTVDIIEAGSSCDYEGFRMDENYFVYAEPHPVTGRLIATKMTHTGPLRAATADLAYAQLDAPPPPALRGLVQVNDRRARRVLSGVPITIIGPGSTVHTVTDTTGHFRVEGLPDGIYVVHADLPPPYVPTTDQIINVWSGNCELFAYFYASLDK
jgi:hypothetical protein